jgi:hypothetical protein
VRLPVWLTLGIAAIVLFFGLFRIRLGLRPAAKPGEDQPHSVMGGGLYRMTPRTHLLIGIVYLLLAGALIATSFGWNPFGSVFGPSTETPAKDKAPTKGGVPIDTVPAKK